MIKRTTGRLLLTSLVITGLAGTLNNSSLSQKERKQAISLIRSSRNEVLKSVNGLSPKQMNYKPSPKDPSIGELLVKMVSLEKNCSEHIRTIMNEQANAENRLKITMTDEQLLQQSLQALSKMNLPEDGGSSVKDPAEAIKKFISLREHHIRYIRTSTEDLRNHVLSTPQGWIDCYQYFLLIADESRYFAEKIKEIKASPGFPRK